MSIDVTAKLAFGYGGGNMVMADEHTLAYASGNFLQFTSTVTNAQHFLSRQKPRKITAFDCKNSEIAIASRNENPSISLYSYPDKKFRGKLQNGALFEYSHVKFSRCGKRILSISADEGNQRLIVWDSDRCEQIKGLSSTIVLDASFASFDPSNFEQFIIGGRDGIQIWKTYKGRNTHYLRSTKLPIPRDIETKKQQFTCHCWGNNGHFYAANRYGELLFIDAITVRVIQVIDTASRASGTSISALLCTSDFLLITYFDGEVYWLSMKDYEIVQTVSLPEGSMGKESNQIVSMTPSPSYSKAYIGTRGGVIYELKTHVDLDDEDEDDEEKAISSLLSTWGSFHAGPAFACCTLTPFGGMYGSDSLIVSSGLNGMICFWSISKGRLLSHCNIPSLFGSTANESAIGMSFSASAITAVVARATDPVLAVGDQSGKLRFLCVSKGVGNGLIEFLPLHSIQILEAPVDTMHVHPSQPYLLVSSTFDKLVFIVSMDHEKRFEVVSISTISDESDRIVDVKWSFSENSTTHLKFICFTTNGSIESGVYSCDGGFAPIKLKLERVSYGVELTKRCNHFLPIQGVPPNILLATSHTTRDVALFKYTQGSEGEAGTVLWKTLVQDAHEQGVSCIARFECLLRGDEELFVTGDLNGVITLWMITYGGSSVCNFRDLEDVQVVKKNSISLHDGPVTSVNIFDMQEALYVISTGKEGNVFVLEVRIPQEIETMRPPLSLEMNTMYTNLVSFAKYDNMQPGTESNKPILQIWKDEQEAADRSKFDVAKEKIRSPLNKLEAKLKLLLSENEKLQPNEQLQREDFVINTDWRNHLMSLNKDRAQRVRDNIMKELAKMSIVRERMKGEFWESTAVKGLKLYSLQSGSFVFNFPMRKLDKKESSLKTKLDLLRLVEFQHQAQEVNDCGAIKETSYLSRFKEIVPPNLQWMIDAGLHHPAFNRWFEKSRSSNTPLDFSSGHPFLPSVFNDIKSFMLVYHPVTIRTRKQQRTQIQLLHAYERYLLTEYNNEFAEMVKLKQSKIEEIDAKNARIEEICAELGVTWEFFRPVWHSDEHAASILEVKPEEMTQKIYETEEMRSKREKEAADRAELELQRKKDDVAGRALNDMMNGTLETKKDSVIQHAFIKEQWMIDTPIEDMSPEQRKLLQQFEAAQQKFQEEKEKYRKSLDLELKKLKGEISDICKGFDEKLKNLQEIYLLTRVSVLSQQLYELRLAEGLIEHEHLLHERNKLSKNIESLQLDIRRAEKENEIFSGQVEACRDEWQRAQEEDKALEKSFPRDLEELVGIPLDHELLKHLIELYKKRKADDVRDDNRKQTPKQSGSKSTLGRTGSKHLMTDASSSAHSLSPAILLQTLQSSHGVSATLEAEHNYDPFQNAESEHRKPELRRVISLDPETDRPDGIVIDKSVWKAVNDLRMKKIHSEYFVKEKFDLLNRARLVLDEMRSKAHELTANLEREILMLKMTNKQLANVSESTPLLVHIKQGQDETSGEDIFSSSQDALLVSRSSVESLNEVILLHGKEQVGILGKIKNFRKNINLMEWEHTSLELQMKDMEERYTDIQLLRVTKELQDLFHNGDTSEKQKKEAALLEAKLVHLRKHHQANLMKLERTNSKLLHQLKERQKENERFSEQVQQLEIQVQIREDILASRKSASLRTATGTLSDAQDTSSSKLKAIMVRRKLVNLAKAQTDEIEFLRQELDKMRKKTFPSFASNNLH